MKVQKFEQSVSLSPLDHRGNMEGLQGSPKIELYGLKKIIPGKEDINTGIFECSAGTYRRSVKQAEVMHILSGSGSFTQDNGEAVNFQAGDSLFFAEDTQGTWVVDTQMRKIYVIL